jgi:hypothetical protein
VTVKQKGPETHGETKQKSAPLQHVLPSIKVIRRLLVFRDKLEYLFENSFKDIPRNEIAGHLLIKVIRNGPSGGVDITSATAV